MKLTERITAITQLGQHVETNIGQNLDPIIQQAIVENPWFTKAGIEYALTQVSQNFFDQSKLSNWIADYDIKDDKSKRVGLVLAGNIPMVGIHDVLSVFVSGHKSVIKFSHKDTVLIEWLISQLAEIDERTTSYFEGVERLNKIDAVITTGGDTAATHFEYYFSKYPNIIRKNRSSVAVLREEDQHKELKDIGKDIFTYFGLGCRNVSKLYIHENFDIQRIFESIVDFEDVINHNKYKNNYDYSNAIYLLGNITFLTNNFLIVREDEGLSSRIACIHYERYRDEGTLVAKLEAQMDKLQCIASTYPVGDLPFTAMGNCQSPGLNDYADGVDTMSFLTGLYD